MTASRHVKAHTLATTSAIAILLSSVAPQLASAQQAAQAPAAVDEIVVTGSRIVRDGYEAPTPVSVLGAEELDSMNANNIADAVNALPAFSGSVKPRNMTANLSSGAAGVNQLNLRGMGTNRTLILLDGQRVINSSLTASNSAPDINSFPNGLVQRVDVVTGGASAAYGSDALSGVVNFIIDKEFTGIKGEVQGGMTQWRDDKNYNVSLTAGTPFGGGRGHFLIAGEVGYIGGIGGVPRDWNDSSAAMVVNPAWTANPASGAPQYIVARDVGLSRGTPGGVITAGPLKGIMFGPGGTPAPFVFGTDVGNNFMQGGDWRVSRIDDGLDLDQRVKRYVAYSRLSYDISDNITAFVDAQWANAHADNTSNPNRRLGNNTILVDNAFIPTSVRNQMVALGLTSFTLGSTNVDTQRFRADNRRTLRRFSGGLDGSVTAFETDWTWNAYLQHSMTGLSPRTPHVGITRNYLKAIDAVVSGGNIVCRVNADANPANDDPACVPFNVMGIGVNNQKAVDYVTGTAYRYESLKQDVMAFSVNGEPLELWAGPVSLAFGVEHRKESVKGMASALDEATSFFAGNYHASFGSFHVTEGFVETLIPLAKDEEWARSLDLNAAVRATSYSTSGYVTTWKVGLTYAPVDDFRFRMTRSRDIRAPNLGELFTAGQTNSGEPLFDPFLNVNIPASFRLTRGNPNLLPEKADTTGLGIVFQPTFLQGFQASADFFNINVKGSVQAPSGQTVVNLCFAGNTVLCNAIQRGADGLIFQVITQPENLISQKAQGIDFEASYRTPASVISESLDGNFSVRAMATRMIKLRTVNTQGISIDGTGVVGEWGGISPFSGNLTAPKWKGLMTFGYDTDVWNVRMNVRYTGAGKYDNGNFVICSSGCPTSTSTKPTMGENHIPSATTLDLSGGFKPFDEYNVEIFGTVENLLNATPPIIGGSLTAAYYNGMGNKDYDVIGRQYRAGVRFQF
ncbi:MAG: TonB-dependent receptor [Proteobacteria bacterium]|nr:TonB-dependent receptor [Pseudomonadota bacterium]